MTNVNFYREQPFNSANQALIDAAKKGDYLYLLNHIHSQDQRHPDEHFDEKLENRASLQLLRAKALELPPEAIIVDACAGNSNFLAELSRCGRPVIGVDISPVRVIMSRQRTPHLDIRFGLAEDMPIRSQSVGAIVSTEALEHVFDLDKTLNEFVRILDRNGPRKLFAQVPLLNFADGVNHLRHFTPQSLMERLVAKKFRIDECLIIPYLCGEQPNNIFVSATLVD